jgi:hypothetical protein
VRRRVETIFSTAWSVSVTRSAAGRVNCVMASGKVGHTIFFGAGGEVRRRCGHHHTPCLVSDGNEQVMNLLQIEFCHCEGIGVSWRSDGERGEKMERGGGVKKGPVFADSLLSFLSTRALDSGIREAAR